MLIGRTNFIVKSEAIHVDVEGFVGALVQLWELGDHVEPLSMIIASIPGVEYAVDEELVDADEQQDPDHEVHNLDVSERPS